MCVFCELRSRLETLEQVKRELETEGLRDSNTYQQTLTKIGAVKVELKEKESVLTESLTDLLAESLHSEPLFHPLYNDPKKGNEN